MLAAVPAFAQSGSDLFTPPGTENRRIVVSEGTPELKIAIAWGNFLKPPAKYPRAMINLRDALQKWTTIPVTISGQFRIGSPDLLKLPIVFISTEEQFDLTETERNYLQEYLRKGGFLVVDDAASDIPNSPSGAALLQMVREIAGDRWVGPVRSDHPIFRSPFVFDGPPRGNENTPFRIPGIEADSRNVRIKPEEERPLLGMFIDDRLAILYSPRGYYATWNDDRNTPQLKFGVNLVMYALGIE